MDKKNKKGVEDNKEKVKDNKENSRKDYSKQTTAVLLIMAVIFISLIATYFIMQGNNTVDYHGITFSKENQGGIMHYKSLLGYVTGTGEPIPFILQLRTDPTELEEIPINANIKLLDEGIISLSPEVIDCEDTGITMIDLSMTLKAFGTSTIGATTDENLSRKDNIPLADCRNSLEKTVIIFKEGNETKIIQEKIFFTNCYIIEVNNCEMRKGYEKFLLHYIENSVIKKDG